MQEDKIVEGKTVDLLGDWDKQKPLSGSMRPDQAAQTLQMFESKFNRLKDDRENIVKAKEALELSEPGYTSANAERMKVAIEEMQDLKAVWTALSGVWSQIDEIKEKPWLSIQPRKVFNLFLYFLSFFSCSLFSSFKLRQQIDATLNSLKELPANYRNYEAYEHVKKLLQGYAKINVLIVDLKSEALKERHWKALMKQLRVNWNLSDLTLGQVL